MLAGLIGSQLHQPPITVIAHFARFFIAPKIRAFLFNVGCRPRATSSLQYRGEKILILQHGIVIPC